MPTPNELVTEAFAQAQSYATTAQGQLAGFTTALNNAVQNAPLVDITFTPLSPPGAGTVPTAPGDAPADVPTIVPVFTPPTGYSPTLGTDTALSTRLVGGTGLSNAVEQGIWDRAREREVATMQAQVDQVTRDSEALGFALPPGVLAEEVRRASRAYYDTAAALSRDIAVEQAKLEQSNIQKTIDQAIEFDRLLVDGEAKQAETAAALYRAQVAAFEAEVTRYRAQGTLFELQVRRYEAEIMRFRAEVEQDTRLWEASIKQNEAIATYTINGQKLNSEIIRANLSAALEAGKVGAQVYSQLTAAAYSLIHASASVGASANMQVSYSYGNDTSTQPAAITAI